MQDQMKFMTSKLSSGTNYKKDAPAMQLQA